jgi:hypothetical protein
LFGQNDQILFIAAPHPDAEVLVWQVDLTAGGWWRWPEWPKFLLEKRAH